MSTHRNWQMKCLPYSSDQGASDFFLFLKLKIHHKGNKFEAVEGIKNTTMQLHVILKCVSKVLRPMEISLEWMCWLLSGVFWWKKINVLLIIDTFFGKYSFSLDIFATKLVFRRKIDVLFLVYFSHWKIQLQFWFFLNTTHILIKTFYCSFPSC